MADNAVSSAVGRVSLVGTGPGDASLMTLRAVARLQSADYVLYDSLVHPEILDMARSGSVFEDVGKRRGYCPKPQDAISSRLVELARAGHGVCRLKGGDPYIYGRGGEEALALADAGIPFEVVPGITSASAVAASSGIPLTHRRVARTVRFLTGHLALEQLDTQWEALVHEQETLVIYMGLSHIDTIAEGLMAAGARGDLPVAFIQNGARATERRLVSDLAHAAAARWSFTLTDGPVLIIVGRVVELAEVLQPDMLHFDNEKHS